MGSSKSEVEVSYDVSNEFFRLWLDERMNYTSAVFESETQSLEAAQLNKLRILSDFARVRQPVGSLAFFGGVLGLGRVVASQNRQGFAGRSG